MQDLEPELAVYFVDKVTCACANLGVITVIESKTMSLYESHTMIITTSHQTEDIYKLLGELRPTTYSLNPCPF